MKILQITFRFQHGERIEAILRRHGVENMSIHSMVEGWDFEGKHDGSQVYPGHMTWIQAEVPDKKVDGILEDLGRFREEKKTHHHLRAVVIPVERVL
jgi:hypothetical protein